MPKRAALSPPAQAFLDELRDRLRRVGWLVGDYQEVAGFVMSLYREAGIPLEWAELEPYETEDE